MGSSKKYDLVVYGATGFTGRLASLYVAKQYTNTIHWAIAGRSQEKLAKIMSECQGHPEIVLADSSDQASIEAMVAQTKVVVTYAGPFARYGSGLVAACVKAGVDYCDITGEVDWVREMIAKHDDAAKASGARIVSLCGHDSLPWDLMTLLLFKKLRENDRKAELARLEYWDTIKSMPSGGTIETACGILFGTEKNKPKSPGVKALGFDPLLKLPSGETGPSTHKLSSQNVSILEQANPKKGHAVTRTFFFMANVNANAVKRSNALNKYGSNVVYCEGVAWKGLMGVSIYLMAMGMLGLGLAIPPIRWLLRKYVLPKPGEGPSEEVMEKGFLHLTGVATSTDGKTAKGTMHFFKDPGYMDTARMAIEAGLALSIDGAKLPNKSGGVFTPGCCQGEVVMERLLKTGTAFEYESTRVSTSS